MIQALAEEHSFVYVGGSKINLRAAESKDRARENMWSIANQRIQIQFVLTVVYI